MRWSHSVAILILLYCLTGGVFYLLFTTELIDDPSVHTLRLTIFVFMLPLLTKYVVQLISAFYYRRQQKNRVKNCVETKLPKVSVLVPAWNEEVGILRTIRSVLATNYADLELIVINDGSTDQTGDLVKSFIEDYQEHNDAPCDIKYLELINGGKARALNQGLACSTGEFIITIDADSIMDSNAIIKMLEQFDDPVVGAVAGNVIVGNRKQRLALLQQLEYLYGFFFKRADSVFDSVYIIGGAAAAYRKTTLDAVRGFDHDVITEDIEMSMRILSHNFKTRFAADAVVYTEGPVDLKGLSKQRLRWKFGRLTTFYKHKDMFFNRRLNNPYLSYLLLPVALYAELSLLLEPLLLAIFYGYTFYTNDYLPLAGIIIFITCMITYQIRTDSKRAFHKNIICLAPVAWILFYIIDFIELKALVQSIKRLIKRQELQWQSWNRVGLLSKKI